MSRRTSIPKRLHYEQDYVSYWVGKGDYGRERVERMRARKIARAIKLRRKQENRRKNYCPHCGRYRDSYDCF
jgi:hypothetical protein